MLRFTMAALLLGTSTYLLLSPPRIQAQTGGIGLIPGPLTWVWGLGPQNPSTHCGLQGQLRMPVVMVGGGTF